MGDRLGYYRSLAQHGPTTPAELAERTGTDEHYAREWLNAQAAGEFVCYDAATGRYHLPDEQAVALTDETSPAFVTGLFQIAHGTICDATKIIDAARAGDGMGWGEHNSDVHVGCERFFAPTYHAHLITEWLPALEGVEDKLTAGATVADVGCGHGASTIEMAQAFPSSTFRGTDAHAPSIATAQQRAQAAGVASQIGFQTADAASFTGGPYELITMFDCLHDMGDPVGAARHVRQVIAEDGTWMIVEPAAGRPRRRQPQPGGTRLLRVLHVAVHPVVAVAAGRAGAGHAGRSRPHPRCGDRGRLHPFPSGRTHAVPQRFRSSAVTPGAWGPP
jgi:2-polyprenyl-3-methyl-5-hydroxy-6-metoxy-1,4-benzoquinol methylase